VGLMKQYILLIIFINLIVIQFICGARCYRDNNKSYFSYLVGFTLAPIVILKIANKSIDKFLVEVVKGEDAKKINHPS
jgi:hypothetical protein